MYFEEIELSALASEYFMGEQLMFHSARQGQEKERGTQTNVYKVPTQQSDAPSSQAQEQGARRQMYRSLSQNDLMH